MTPKDLKPGTKVQISIFQEEEQSDAGLNTTVRRYASVVHDVMDDNTVVLEMPIVSQRVVTLSSDVRYELVFNGGSRFYMAVGTIKRRYKKGNFDLLDFELQTNLEPFQRRKFFRLECSLPVFFIAIGDITLNIDLIGDVTKYLVMTRDEKHIMGHGTVTNISGGGALMISTTDLKDTAYILMRVKFPEDKNEKVETNELVCRILEKSMNENGMYSYRIKFIFHNPQFREKIVQFVFEEQRKIRKKEQGN